VNVSPEQQPVTRAELGEYQGVRGQRLGSSLE
jgi:hypothetical protein